MFFMSNPNGIEGWQEGNKECQVGQADNRGFKSKRARADDGASPA
jgi:hypothetical protein